MARVKIPTKFEEQLKLGELIAKKDKELGDKSPLKSAFEMSRFEKIITDANIHNDKKDECERQAEKETELRDEMWDINIADIRSIAQFLKAMYKKTPHELGEWGFDIDEYIKPKKD